jgi:hypothetical protein
VKIRNRFDVWNVILKVDYPIDYLKTFLYCSYAD